MALRIYNDKRDRTEVAKAFAFMLSYIKVLPERLPDFYNYLLSYKARSSGKSPSDVPNQTCKTLWLVSGKR